MNLGELCGKMTTEAQESTEKYEAENCRGCLQLK